MYLWEDKYIWKKRVLFLYFFSGQKGDEEHKKTKMLSHNLFVLQQCPQQNLK